MRERDRNRQEQSNDALSFIVNYINHHQFAPTLRDIGQIVGRAPSNVHNILGLLKDEGSIKFDTFSSRTITVTLTPHPIDFKAGNPNLQQIQPLKNSKETESSIE